MLQAVQNIATRIATGSRQRASSDHFHAETQLLPDIVSLGMVCFQYMASALRTSPPSRAIVTQSFGPLIKKDTLHSKFLSSISHYLSYGIISADIHQTTVQNAILNQLLNNVLQDRPPTVDPVEKNSSKRQ